MKYKNIFLALLSGFLLILIFPKFNYEILAWVALVPLFWAIRGKSPSQAAFLGFITGFVFFTGILYWIQVVLTQYGNLPAPISLIIVLVLTAYLGLYIAAFAFFLNWLIGKTQITPVIWGPSLWVSFEYLRGILLSGFSWEMLGYSQFQNLSMIQIADITGVYGVSFMVVLVNAALYRMAEGVRERRWKLSFQEITAAGMVLAVCGIYGYFRLVELSTIPSGKKSYKVAVVQGNIRQDIKWDAQFQEETIKIYADLTRGLQPDHPDLILWPETAAPFFFQNTTPLQSGIMDLAHQMNAPFILGAPASERKGPRIHLYNSAFLVSPEKKIVGRYDKVHLVPFGEYAPLAGLLGFTGGIIGAMGDFTPGPGVYPLSLPWGKFGVLICYEAIFPNLTREFVKQGGEFLVNITNDAWFGRTAAPYQHFSMVALRAVENRVFIARAANTGISGIINPSGRVTKASGLFTREAFSDKIYLNVSPTFYTRFGDLFSYLCIGFIIAVLIILRLPRGHRVERSGK
jgi:apolipoprotein N-acyltransferase